MKKIISLLLIALGVMVMSCNEDTVTPESLGTWEVTVTNNSGSTLELQYFDNTSNNDADSVTISIPHTDAVVIDYSDLINESVNSDFWVWFNYRYKVNSWSSIKKEKVYFNSENNILIE